MSHLETNLSQLKDDLVQMWNLVGSQMEKARLSMINNDKDLAREVRANEKMVDAFELKIDMDCENIIMLQNPVAIDLRFLLSVLKVNYNLERIGDYANSIAKSVEASDKDWPVSYIDSIHVPEMFFLAQSMIQQSLNAFETGDRKQIKGLFSFDQKLDKINNECLGVITSLIRENIDDTALLLDTFSIIRKLERAGDHIKNIAEELIFYFDAIIVKHSKLKKQ
ncbi:MAG: phosphate signaling complex protein PhoU [Bacteroidetes bacterium]|nr:phosphate signaling complex protein PhoU [Bacteroidota bacterium]